MSESKPCFLCEKSRSGEVLMVPGAAVQIGDEVLAYGRRAGLVLDGEMMGRKQGETA